MGGRVLSCCLAPLSRILRYINFSDMFELAPSFIPVEEPPCWKIRREYAEYITRHQFVARTTCHLTLRTNGEELDTSTEMFSRRTFIEFSTNNNVVIITTT